MKLNRGSFACSRELVCQVYCQVESQVTFCHRRSGSHRPSVCCLRTCSSTLGMGNNLHWTRIFIVPLCFWKVFFNLKSRTSAQKHAICTLLFQCQSLFAHHLLQLQLWIEYCQHWVWSWRSKSLEYFQTLHFLSIDLSWGWSYCFGTKDRLCAQQYSS